VTGTFAPAGRAGRGRYVRLVSAFAAALAPVAVLSAEPAPLALAATAASLAVAGLFLTPIAATSYVLTQQATAPGQRTEAFAWLSTGQAAGNAAGAAMAGLTAAAGPAAALGVLPAAVALAALLARSRLPPDTPAGQ
jgi:predicted MFS family arabinose efflux permease